jgi:uncharacterized protein with PIN domain
MSEFETQMQPMPTCPHCGYALDSDDMHSQDADLWAAAPKESREIVKCPQCDNEYWIQGGYIPSYTSAFSEEELQ